MKTIEVPQFFHEVFGKRITAVELILTLLFSVAMTLFILVYSYPELRELEPWKTVVIILLSFDISGGVIANFTLSTNNHYKENPRARLIFILMHVQPVILTWLAGDYLAACIYVWLYTVGAAFIVNALLQHPIQRVAAAIFMAAGIGSVLLLFTGIPDYLLVILLFYMIKVIFSFAVDHYGLRKEEL